MSLKAEVRENKRTGEFFGVVVNEAGTVLSKTEPCRYRSQCLTPLRDLKREEDRKHLAAAGG